MSPEARIQLLALLNRVRAHRGLPALETVPRESRLREDLGLDSLDLAELTVRIEDRFGTDVFAKGVVRTWGEVLSRLNHHGTDES